LNDLVITIYLDSVADVTGTSILRSKAMNDNDNFNVSQKVDSHCNKETTGIVTMDMDICFLSPQVVSFGIGIHFINRRVLPRWQYTL
jgi:hypothetical protein